MGSPHFGFPWTASSSPRRSLVTLELKRHKFVPMVATKWALQLLSKRQRIQMISINFCDQSIWLERLFRKCSAVCTQCHQLFIWDTLGMPNFVETGQTKVNPLSQPNSGIHSRLPSKLICSIKKAEEKNRDHLIPPQANFLQFWAFGSAQLDHF